MIAARELIGSHDIVFLTLDSLRLDVARAALANGRLPVLSGMLPNGAWEHRHSPATFTYAAHQAFFAGFLPTPANQPAAERLFAMRFAGSRSIGSGTAQFDAPDIVTALGERGYHTICVGGVGFFNKLTHLSRQLPGLFAESHWSPKMGVTDRASQRHQVACACEALERRDDGRVFLFVNFAATHPPTRAYLGSAGVESAASQEAALAAIDAALPPLVEAVKARGPSLWVVTSDHGTTFGDDGFHGHRLAHPAVSDVPYGEFVLEGA